MWIFNQLSNVFHHFPKGLQWELGGNVRCALVHQTRQRRHVPDDSMALRTRFQQTVRQVCEGSARSYDRVPVQWNSTALFICHLTAATTRATQQSRQTTNAQ